MAIQNRNVNKRRFKPKVHPRRGGSARGGVIAYDPTDPLHEPIANSSSHATPKRRLHIVESSTKHKERVTNLAMYHDRKPIFLASVAVVVYLLLGGIYYMASVEWSFLDSLYFTVTTLTTVGYGDIKPETDAQKIGKRRRLACGHRTPLMPGAHGVRCRPSSAVDDSRHNGDL